MVKPIHKSGDKKLVKNYQPISTLPNINKIFEKLIYCRLSYFFESTGVISDAQYGFRKSRDTQLAALKLIDCILPAFSNNDTYAACIFLDFSKAFDTVDHQLLLTKLEKYGIRGTAHKLLYSYLSNRKMTVQINNKFSKSVDVNIGVPQGSCLGPLLYLLYANDLQNILCNLTPVVFADDTSLIETSNCLPTLTLKLNYLLSIIIDWSNYNKLSLNKDKTKWMLFRHRSADEPKLYMNGEIIERVDTFKYLGFIIDNKLKHNAHLINLRSRMSRLKYILYKIKLLLSIKAGLKF